ncbi:hypothetical protein BGX26_008636 [Mortierella sp. AD094]|nr:hypothetical protein BGX26_008636 [Mortierella sp. AD094]
MDATALVGKLGATNAKGKARMPSRLRDECTIWVGDVISGIQCSGKVIRNSVELDIHISFSIPISFILN